MKPPPSIPESLEASDLVSLAIIDNMMTWKIQVLGIMFGFLLNAYVQIGRRWGLLYTCKFPQL